MWWLLIPIGAAIVGAVIDKTLKEKKTKGITVLGTKGVGKTSFFNTLRGKVQDQDARATVRTEEIEKITISRKDGSQFYLKKTYDISGADETLVGDEYEKLIKTCLDKKDYVIFIFNSKKIYDGDSTELDIVNARLRKIIDVIDREKIEAQFLLIGSWADQIPGYNLKDSNKNLKDKVWNQLNGKLIGRLKEKVDFEKRFFLFDMSNPDVRNKLKERILEN